MNNQVRKRKLAKVRHILQIIISFLGPVVFEIANTISGDWCDNQGQFNYSLGKVITIIIGSAYILLMIYFVWKDLAEQRDVSRLEQALSTAEHMTEINKAALSDIENALGYSTDCVKKQSEYLLKNQDVKIRELGIVNFATTACAIYHRIFSSYYNSQQFTVNIYHKYKKEDKKTYHTMVAHEGHITSPKYFGTERLLRQNKSNYFCDKILLSDNPEFRIILDPIEVAKQFQKDVSDCKYKQYISIPIMDNHHSMRLMVEINVIDKCILGNDTGKVLSVMNELFTPINNYLKLMITIEEYAHNVESEFCMGDNNEY